MFAQGDTKGIEDRRAKTLPCLRSGSIAFRVTVQNPLVAEMVLRRSGNGFAERYDQGVDELSFAQINQAEVLWPAGWQDKGEVTGRLPPRLPAGGNCLKVEHVIAHELDEGRARRQREGNRSVVGAPERSCQVHLRDPPRQLCFELFPALLPARKLLVVRRTPFGAGSG
jgi:hypothetical protein